MPRTELINSLRTIKNVKSNKLYRLNTHAAPFWSVHSDMIPVQVNSEESTVTSLVSIADLKSIQPYRSFASN